MDVRMFTVGPLQENCFLVRRDGATECVIVDPGEDAPIILGAVDELKLTVAAVLLTHTHFDHVGAVAEVARATGAPVYCPEREAEILANINDYVFSGFGPFEAYQADHVVSGGETLELAGLQIDVIFTPGHSPGHVTYAVADESPAALFSGDVLFAGSIGRVDLPGGDYHTLMTSIVALLDAYEDDTRVHPGHMGVTTLGAERATNPFLTELTRR